MIADRIDGAPPGGMTARETADAVRAGVVSAASLLAQARAATDAWEPWLGAVVTRSAEPAAVSDGALAGVVLGVKDLLHVRGLPRWCGAPDLVEPEPAEADATAVARLRQAGATVVGTTQTHQFAYGIVTPQTRNPRAPDRVAGGSSGGSAAVVAAGIAHVALGTDTGGSVRIPAACCGVVGMKPTFGGVPVDGSQPLAPSLDTVGLLAGDVPDLALGLSVLLGRPLGATAPATLRVGVPAHGGAGIDEEVRACVERVASLLERAGAQLHEPALPSLADAPRANGVVLAMEALATHAERMARGPDGWWSQVWQRLEAGRALTTDDRAWADTVRARLTAELADAWRQVDVLLTPTLSCRVPVVGAEHVLLPDGAIPITPAMTRLTSPWNLVGLPAGSLPAGRDSGGAPIGVQVIGPPGGEEQVLRAMALIEQLVGGPSPVVGPPRRRTDEESGPGHR